MAPGRWGQGLAAATWGRRSCRHCCCIKILAATVRMTRMTMTEAAAAAAAVTKTMAAIAVEWVVACPCFLLSLHAEGLPKLANNGKVETAEKVFQDKPTYRS